MTQLKPLRYKERKFSYDEIKLIYKFDFLLKHNTP